MLTGNVQPIGYYGRYCLEIDRYTQEEGDRDGYKRPGRDWSWLRIISICSWEVTAYCTTWEGTWYIRSVLQTLLIEKSSEV